MNETFGEHSLLDYALNRSGMEIAGGIVEIYSA